MDNNKTLGALVQEVLDANAEVQRCKMDWVGEDVPFYVAARKRYADAIDAVYMHGGAEAAVDVTRFMTHLHTK